jgi:hypothetical protein
MGNIRTVNQTSNPNLWVAKKRAEILTLIEKKRLDAGSFYLITDAEGSGRVVVFAVDRDTISMIGFDAITGEMINYDIVSNTISASGGGGGASAYKVYSALLNQSGTDAPTAIVLQNTLEMEVDYQYDNTGRYNAVLGSSVNISSLFVLIGDPDYEDANATPAATYAAPDRSGFFWGGDDYVGSKIKIITQNGAGAFLNSNLKRTPIEIRVYN